MTVGNGPTQNYEMESDFGWLARPGLARLIRFVLWLVPVALSFLTIWSLAHWFPPARLGLNVWLWWGLAVVLASLVMWGAERVARRFTPLIALMQMTLVFPDKAPSRYKAALRSGTVAQLKKRIAEAGDTEKEKSEAYFSELLVDMTKVVADHDRLTRGHSERVRTYTDMIAEEMGLPKADRDKLRWSALLHDVGKLTVPPEILNKPGRPDEAEWKVIQGHPGASNEFLAPFYPWLGDWVLAASQHHERFDGGGYPLGLTGSEMHLGSRIVAVADAYDVMTSKRSYKEPMEAHLAREEVARNAGTQFDPAVVRAFLNLGLGSTTSKLGALSWLANIPKALGSTAPLAPAASPMVAIATGAAATAAVAVGSAAGVIAPEIEPVDPVPEEIAFVEPSATPTPVPSPTAEAIVVVVPTATATETPLPTVVFVEAEPQPTATTLALPTSTAVPATATAIPPTSTEVPTFITPVPPTAIPPTAAPLVVTATPIPPIPIPPTVTIPAPSAPPTPAAPVVTNQPPVFDVVLSGSLQINQTASTSDPVGQLTAQDADNDQLEFSLKDETRFDIGKYTGQVTVASAVVLSESSYDLTVLVTDGKHDPVEKNVTVDVNRQPTAVATGPELISQVNNVKRTVATVEGDDPDGDALTYSLKIPVAGFSVNTNGVVSAAPGAFVADQTKLTVLVDDDNNDPTEVDITVNVNLQPMVTASSTQTIIQTPSAGDPVGSVQFDNPEADPFLDVTIDSPLFAVDRNGTVTIAESVVLRAESYTFDVTIDDKVNNPVTETLTVNVNRRASATPSYPDDVRQTAQVGDVIAEFIGFDVDGDSITYELEEPSTVFEIAEGSNKVTIKQPTLLTNPTSFDVMVDDDINERVPVTVTVPVNLQPVVTLSSTVEVPQTATKGDPVGSVSFTNSEADDLSVTVNNALFTVDLAGNVTVKDDAFLANASYLLTVTIDDGVNDPVQEMLNIAVNQQPTVTASSTVEVPQTATKGDPAATVSFTNPETDPFLKVTVDNSLFTVDLAGNVTVKNDAFLANVSYPLTVTIDDGVNKPITRDLTVITDQQAVVNGTSSQIVPQTASAGDIVGSIDFKNRKGVKANVDNPLFEVDAEGNVVLRQPTFLAADSPPLNVTISAGENEPFVVEVPLDLDLQPVPNSPTTQFEIAQTAAEGFELGPVTFDNPEAVEVTVDNALFAIDLNNNVVVGQASLLPAGTYSITVTIDDRFNTAMTETWTVVVNQRPTATTDHGIDVAEISDSNRVAATITVIDPDGNTIPMTLDNPPAGVTLNGNQIMLAANQYVADGTQVTALINDDINTEVRHTITLDLNQQPEVSSETTIVAEISDSDRSAATITVIDPDGNTIPMTLDNPPAGVTLNGNQIMLAANQYVADGTQVTALINDDINTEVRHTITLDLNQQPEVSSETTTVAEISDSDRSAATITVIDPDGNTIPMTLDNPPAGVTLNGNQIMLAANQYVADGTQVTALINDDINTEVRHTITLDLNQQPEVSSETTIVAEISDSDRSAATITVIDPDGNTIPMTLDNPPAGVTLNGNQIMLAANQYVADGTQVTALINDDINTQVRHTITLDLNQQPGANDTIYPPDVAEISTALRRAATINPTDADGDSVTLTLDGEPTGVTLNGADIMLAANTDIANGTTFNVLIDDGTNTPYPHPVTLQLNQQPEVSSETTTVAEISDSDRSAATITVTDPDGNTIPMTLENPPAGVTLNGNQIMLAANQYIANGTQVTALINDDINTQVRHTITLDLNQQPGANDTIYPPDVAEISTALRRAATINPTDADGDSVTLTLDGEPNGVILNGADIMLAANTDIANGTTFNVLIDDGTNTPYPHPVTLQLNQQPVVSSETTRVAEISDSDRSAATITVSDPDGNTIPMTLDNPPTGVTLNGNQIMLAANQFIADDTQVTALINDDINTQVRHTITLDLNQQPGANDTIYPPDVAEISTALRRAATINPTDSDGDSVTLTLDGEPTGVTLNGADIMLAANTDIANGTTFNVLIDDGTNTPYPHPVTLQLNQQPTAAPVGGFTAGPTAGAGQAIGQVAGTDPGDPPDQLQYSFDPSDPPPSGVFTLDNDTGHIEVDGTTALDINNSPYQFTVLVDDGINSPYKYEVTVTIVTGGTTPQPDFYAVSAFDLPAGEWALTVPTSQSVLINDLDADGDNRRNAENVTVIDEAQINGSLEWDKGAFKYNPAPLGPGDPLPTPGAQLDQFTYRVIDGSFNETAVVTILYMPPPPPVPVPTAPDDLPDVVISEVRLGGPNGPQDGFIELYNTTDAAISLQGWRIADQTGAIYTIDGLFGFSIPAHGHILIAGEDYHGSVTRDETMGTLNDSHTSLMLLPPVGDTPVDQVDDLAKQPSVPLSSVERLGGSTFGSCVDTNTDAHDFRVRLHQDPQNASSSEPTPCPVVLYLHDSKERDHNAELAAGFSLTEGPNIVLPDYDQDSYSGPGRGLVPGGTGINSRPSEAPSTQHWNTDLVDGYVFQGSMLLNIWTDVVDDGDSNTTEVGALEVRVATCRASDNTCSEQMAVNVFDLQSTGTWTAQSFQRLTGDEFTVGTGPTPADQDDLRMSIVVRDNYDPVLLAYGTEEYPALIQMAVLATP